MASANDTNPPPKLAPIASPSAPDMQRPGSGELPDFRDKRPESMGDDIEEPPQSDTSALLEHKLQPLDSSHDEDFVARLSSFLATATPGTLGGLAAGLCAIIYLVLGRIGLVIIGAIGGVVLFVSYEASHPDFARAVRREKGTDVIQRLMQELKGAAQDTVADTQENGDEDQLVRSFDDFRPKTREAIKGLVDAIIRDYVRWWYTPIVPSDRSFSLATRKLLSSFLLSISNHLARKRPADAFLDFLTNSTSMTIVFLSELSAAFAELPPDSGVTSIDAVYSYLASHPDSNLASLMNQRQQAAKFHMVAEDILGYLDQSAQNCDVIKVFTREIIANVLLGSTLRTCSQPEWINGWIVYLLEAGEPDISQAIDVGMQSGRDTNPEVLPDPVSGIGSPVPATKIRPSEVVESDGIRKREPVSNHRKKLSKADEEMEEAIEEMKRLNQMIAEEENKRVCHGLGIDDTAGNGSGTEKLALSETADPGASNVSETTSPRPRPSSDKASFNATSTDSRSSTGEIIHTPVTPGSAADSRSPGSSPKQASNPPFTNFDQIVPKASESLGDCDEPRKSSFTLHNATIMIHDESGGDHGRIWSKPSWDYLLQIEPVSSDFPGWMIVRKYADFETLHEVLRRIANISGATAFTEKHATLPLWKEYSRESLRGELEGYLKDACLYQNLAECEGMKRFLDKDQGIPQGGENRYSFGFDALGKNVLGVLTTAPKGAMQGSQAVLDGVTGVLGNFGLGQRKSAPIPAAKDPHPAALGRLSISTPPRVNSVPSPAPSQKARDSMDSQRSSVVFTQPGKIAPMERRPSSQFERDSENEGGNRPRSERFDSPRGSNNPSRASSRPPRRSHSSMSLDGFNLPPIPSEMGDDYEPRPVHHRRSKTTENVAAPPHLSATSPLATTPPITAARGPTSPPKRSRQYTPLTEQETSVAVELMFAIINELYTLTSAWNIRRTLLGAAKSFLLRPGNPSLTSIRALIQESVLDANTSDSGIAAHLRKLRENSVPTEEELATWPAPLTQEEKDKLRDKARRLLIQSGVPAALTGVMGQSATSEAVGRVFDCLQIEEVARGLMFGILLQAARVITH